MIFHKFFFFLLLLPLQSKAANHADYCEILNHELQPNYTNGKWVHDERDINWFDCHDTMNYLGKHWFHANGRTNDLLLGRFRRWSERPKNKMLVWEPDDGCRLRTYSHKFMFDMLKARHLYFIGDSQAYQQYIDLRCQIESFEVQHDLDDVVVNRNGKIFIGALDENVGTISDSIFTPYLVSVSHRRVDSAHVIEEEWETLLHDSRAVLVLNTGAHFDQHSGASTPIGKAACRECSLPVDGQPWPQLELMRERMRQLFNTSMHALFRKLETAPATIVFRTTSPAHEHCEVDGKWQRKHTRPFVAKPWYYWDEFEARNQLQRRLVNQTNRIRIANQLPPIGVIDVYPMLLQRPDEHVLHDDHPPDCLHWLHGPYSVVQYFNRILFNLLHEYKVKWWK